MNKQEKQAFDAMRQALEHILGGALSLPRFAEDEGRAAIALANSVQIQPAQRTGDCLLTGVCASEGHRIKHSLQVPLTDDRIKQLSEEIWGSELDYKHTKEIEFARAIEVSLGIGVKP